MESATAAGEPETQSNDWLEDFANPPATYRPVPFWSWNEVMEPEEIDRQVRLFKQAGWGGAFVHSRVGLITPYLGAEWFAAVDATLEACAREGLLVWLYDEDKWPSGYSGGTVPLADPRFRHKALLARPVGDAAPADAEPIGEPVEGLQIYRWTSPLGDPWFNGTSEVDRGSRDAMRKFLDDAYETYYQRYSEHYGGLIQAEFTDEPCMIFRVEGPRGGVPYSETALERFEEMHGYDALPHLHSLFTDGAGAQRFRLHWHRTINDLFETNYSRQLGEWCADHGIDLTGHYMCEHGVYAQQNWGTKIMPNYRHQQIPGIDHLGRQIAERITGKQCQSVVNQFGKKRMLSELYGVAGGGLTFEDRKWIALQQICLGVNLLNPHLSLYTMAGCRKRDYPQNIFYQQPWWELNHLLDDALSRLCLVMSQGRYRADILLLHPQESAQALWQTRVRDFDQDLTTPYAGQDWNPVTPEGERAVRAIEEHFLGCIDALLGAQRSFDLGDEWILRDSGQVADGERGGVLQVEQMRYRLVVIPPMETMALTTFALLRSFHDAGGAILVQGDPPRKLDGEPSAELTQWIDALPQASALDFIHQIEALSPAGIRFETVYRGDRSLLWVHSRELEDGSRNLLLVNLSRTETFAGDLRVRGEWTQASRLDEHSGRIHALPVEITADHTTSIAIEMEPCTCRLFRLEQGEPTPATAAISPGSVTETTLRDWQVKRLDDNALTLDYASWKQGSGDWSSGPVPVIELQGSLNALAYDGPLCLQYRFTMDGLADDRRVRLVVEHPERCRIRFNQRELAYEGLPHWRDIRWLPIDITGYLRAGQNVITLDYPEFQHGDLTTIEPAEARYGTEIESIYLVGDFAVGGDWTGTAPLQSEFERWQVPPVDVDTLRRDSVVVTDPAPIGFGDVTTRGLPFYAGRIALHTEIPAMDGQVLLDVARLQAPVAEVQIDGRAVGHLLSQPLRVDLTAALADHQPHTLSIIVYSTLRNLLGPHHHVDGELIMVGPDHFRSMEMPQHPDRQAALRAWSEGTWTPDDWREDYCLICFGDLGTIRLLHTPTTDH